MQWTGRLASGRRRRARAKLRGCHGLRDVRSVPR
jgi:hypothetical protein